MSSQRSLSFCTTVASFRRCHAVLRALFGCTVLQRHVNCGAYSLSRPPVAVLLGISLLHRSYSCRHDARCRFPLSPYFLPYFSGVSVVEAIPSVMRIVVPSPLHGVSSQSATCPHSLERSVFLLVLVPRRGHGLRPRSLPSCVYRLSMHGAQEQPGRVCTCNSLLGHPPAFSNSVAPPHRFRPDVTSQPRHRASRPAKLAFQRGLMDWLDCARGLHLAFSGSMALVLSGSVVVVFNGVQWFNVQQFHSDVLIQSVALDTLGIDHTVDNRLRIRDTKHERTATCPARHGTLLLASGDSSRCQVDLHPRTRRNKGSTRGIPVDVAFLHAPGRPL